QQKQRPYWFHGQLGREETERRLHAQGGHGDYLVRYSSATGKYVLSLLHTDGSIYHYPIDRLDDGFYQLRGTESKFLGLDLLLTDFSRALVEASGGIVRRLGRHVQAQEPPPAELIVYGTTTPLHEAVRRGDTLEIRRLLLSLLQLAKTTTSTSGQLSISIVNEKSADTGSTALIDAAKTGNADSVRLLLEAGANTALWDCAGYSALHRAAQKDFVSVVELLLTLGKADPQIRCPLSGNSPLHEAAILGHSNCASALLRHGAAAHPLNADEEMPYELALRFGFAELADYLADWPAEELEDGLEDGDSESHLQRQLSTAVWYHPSLSRADTDAAMRSLSNPPLDGDFLVRLSTSTTSAADDFDDSGASAGTIAASHRSLPTNPMSRHQKRFVLCLASSGSVYKYAIDCDAGAYPVSSTAAATVGLPTGRRLRRKRDAWYIGGGPRHPSLGHLIDYLTRIPDGIPCRLQRPIPPSSVRPSSHHQQLGLIPLSQVLLLSRISGNTAAEIDMFNGRLLSSTTTISSNNSSSASNSTANVAIKVLTPNVRSFNDSSKALKSLADVKLSQLSHKSLVGFVGICLESANNKLMILNELCSVGSAIDYAIRQSPESKPLDLRRWCAQAAQGMAYLASKGCRHGRLSARNILLTVGTGSDSGADKLVAKVSDFGLTDLMSTGFDKHNTALEVGRWYPPELLELAVSLSDPQPATASTESTDVWSFGVCVWELHCCRRYPAGRPTPWHGAGTPGAVLNRLRRGDRLELPEPAAAVVVIKDVVARCMAEAAPLRPGFEWIVKRLA
ncbi:hypothetical protein BOX15_Mlig000491g2, partial [Macrostomum lignano]